MQKRQKQSETIHTQPLKADHPKLEPTKFHRSFPVPSGPLQILQHQHINQCLQCPIPHPAKALLQWFGWIRKQQLATETQWQSAEETPVRKNRLGCEKLQSHWSFRYCQKVATISHHHSIFQNPLPRLQDHSGLGFKGGLDELETRFRKALPNVDHLRMSNQKETEKKNASSTMPTMSRGKGQIKFIPTFELLLECRLKSFFTASGDHLPSFTYHVPPWPTSCATGSWARPLWARNSLVQCWNWKNTWSQQIEQAMASDAKSRLGSPSLMHS